MRKYLLLSLTLLFTISLQAKDIDKLIKQYKDKENATYFYLDGKKKLDKELMQGINEVIRNVDHIEFLSLNQSTENEKILFHNKLNHLNVKSYKTLMLVKSDAADLRFLMLEGRNKIVRFLILNLAKDPWLLSIKGKLPLEFTKDSMNSLKNIMK